MSERKVLQKYYPPDFDPSVLEKRIKKPKDAASTLRLQTIRLMAPFSMKCTSCGEYIYKGRKFNARKETTTETYYAIKIYRFYIRCTRCSAEITFKTDPKNMDYTCEKGARRNFEVWRESKLAEETEEERLDRLEREENERDVMKELEKKTDDARTEMAIADALDDVRTRNAMRERTGVDGAIASVAAATQARAAADEQAEREDAEAARLAFLDSSGEKVRRLVEDIELQDGSSDDDFVMIDRPVDSARTSEEKPTAAAAVKKDMWSSAKMRERKTPGLLPGLKKKEASYRAEMEARDLEREEKRIFDITAQKEAEKKKVTAPAPPPVNIGGLVGYGDESDEDD